MAERSENPKIKLREEARARRIATQAALGPMAAERVRDHFIAALPAMGLDPRGRPSAASGFWSMGDELDVKPLLAALHERGYALGLPVVVARGRPLVFRRWRPGTVLEPAAFGLLQPGADQPEITPDLVITPLLAFDRRGHRLGYGAGYYDMTLADLRRRGRVVAAGVGFAAQAVDELPVTERDQPLDWMVTEEKAWRFRA